MLSFFIYEKFFLLLTESRVYNIFQNKTFWVKC